MGDPDVNAKTPVEVAMFLKENGVSDDICEVFEENELDGQAFSELSEDDICRMSQKLGVVKKIYRLKSVFVGESNAAQGSKVVPVVYSSKNPVSPSSDDTEILSQSTPQSPFSPSLFSPFSPSPSPGPSRFDSDDAISVGSSASFSKPKFCIPDYWPPVIMECIEQPTLEEQKHALNTSIRNDITQALGTHMFSYNPKPTKLFCTEVAKMLVKKYPFMKDIGKKESGYGSWEKKLIEKMHNLKSKKRASSDSESTPKAKRGRPKISLALTRYPPVKDTGNDDITVQRNMQLINKELQKDRPRKEIILSLARQTYSVRRQRILSGSDDLSVALLLQEYCVLKKTYILEQEMDMILEKKDAMQAALKVWNEKIVPAILQYGASSGGKSSTHFSKAQSDFEGDSEKNEKVALVLLGNILPKRVINNPLIHIYEECLQTDDPAEVATRLQVRAAPRFACFSGEEPQYFIFIESEVLSICRSFSHALMLWFISHYVFNLEYSVKVREVALFIQEFVFELPATSGLKRHKTATYLTVSTDIQNYMSSE